MGGTEQILSRIGDLLKGAPGPLIGAGSGLSGYVWIRLFNVPIDLTTADTVTQYAALFACLTVGIGLGAMCQWAVGALMGVFALGRQYCEFRRQKKRFKTRLANLTPTERLIIAKLIVDGRRSFDTDMSGGHASGLIAEGFFRLGGAPNQVAHAFRVPVVIPDPYWEEMMSMRSKFEADIAALQPGQLPWVRPWTAR